MRRRLARVLRLLPALLAPALAGSPVLCVEKRLAGDCNGDSRLDIADPISILSFLFAGTFQPACLARCDVQSDRRVDLSDAVHLFDFLLLGGGGPAPLVMAPEDCDGRDNDCDGLVDEGCSGGVPTYSVRLYWDEVTRDLDGGPVQVAGYRVHVGNAPAFYSFSIEVRGCPCARLTGLQAGKAYYIAVTAIDEKGGESPSSSELRVLR